MIVTVCLGFSCEENGGRRVGEQLLQLVDEYNLQDRVTLNGALCMGNCLDGVNVAVDNHIFVVRPESAYTFFMEEILARCAG